MTSVAQAAAAASILVGLVSIPAVSKTAVEPSQSSVATEMPNVSSNGTTREVSKKLGTEGFSAEIETAFRDFSLEVTPEETDTSVQSAGSRLQVEKSAEKTSWKLSTSTGSLELTRSPKKVKEVVETAQGTLTKVRAGGTVKTSFEGADREAVEASRDELRQLMDQKKQLIDRKRQQFSREASAAATEIDIAANESTAGGYGNNTREHVVFVNEGREVDLEGWKLANNNEEFVELPSYTLESGESVRVYTNDVDAEGITDTGLSWENGGDTATLKNGEGEVVAEKSY